MNIDGIVFIDVAELKQTAGDMEEVVGLESLKRIVEVIGRMAQNPSSTAGYDNIKMPKGIILAGYPGTGKTMVGKLIAKKLNRAFIYIPGAALLSPLPGVGKSRVKALFQFARDNKPCVLFLDEIDSVVKDREQHGSDSGGALQQFLTELDGQEDNEGLLVLAATNVLDQLDAAFKRSGRFDLKVQFNLPSDVQRNTFFVNKLQKYGSSDLDIFSFVELTEGMSYADLEAVWKQSMINAYTRNGKLTNQDMLIAIQRIIYGEASNNVDLVQDQKDALIHHMAGHTMGYIFKPSLFVVGQTKVGTNFICHPKSKHAFIYDMNDVVCQILSISLARESDKLYSKSGASNLYNKDKVKLDSLIDEFFVLIGLYDVGLKNPKEAKRKMSLEFLKIAADIMKDKAYQNLYQNIIKFYMNNEMMSCNDLKAIMRDSKISTNRTKKHYAKFMLRLIKNVGIKSLFSEEAMANLEKLSIVKSPTVDEQPKSVAEDYQESEKMEEN